MRQTNYVHIIISVSIALIMVAMVSALAFGVLWYFNNYVQGTLDPSNNIITECIGQCQEELACESGTSNSYEVISGECKCKCTKLRVKSSNSVPVGWQEYDEQEGFKFYYPSNYEIKNDSTENNIWISSIENPSLPLINVRITDQALESYIKDLQESYIDPPLSLNSEYQLSDGTPQSDVEITIANQEGRKLVFSTAIGLDKVHYLFTRSGLVYDIHSYATAKNTVLQNLKDTFKFIEEADNSWQQYNHENFFLNYPSGWEARANSAGQELALETVTFSAPEIESESLWSVLLYDPDEVEEDTLIAKMGDQFSDRKEFRQRIEINGEEALLVTVTTDLVPNWEHTQVFIKYGGVLYAINDGARGNDGFDTFYNSFQLTNTFN